MRQIKFRAFDKEGNGNTGEPKGKMISMEDWELRYGYRMPIPYKTGRYDFSQFTGLQDKNGNDIYEGDILSKVRHDVQGNWGFPLVHKKEFAEFVEFKNGSFCTQSEEVLQQFILVSHQVEAEIIGNIFENPEIFQPHD